MAAPVFQTDISFLVKWSKKSKLSVKAEICYLVQLEYAEFNGDVHFFRFQMEISFLVKLIPKFKIVFLKWNLVPRLIWVCRIQWMMFTFLNFFVLGQQYPFRTNLVQEVKIVNLSLNLVPRLIPICRILEWC